MFEQIKFKKWLETTYKSLQHTSTEAAFTGGFAQLEIIIKSTAFIFNRDYLKLDSKTLLRYVEAYYAVYTFHVAKRRKAKAVISALLTKFPDIVAAEKAKLFYIFVVMNISDNTYQIMNKDELDAAAEIVDGLLEIQAIQFIDDKDNPKYGIDGRFPIGTNGPDGSEMYLASLRTQDDAIIQWNRVGSQAFEGVPGLVDMYKIISTSDEAPSMLYLNMYSDQNSTTAPKGMNCIYNLKNNNSHAAQVVEVLNRLEQKRDDVASRAAKLKGDRDFMLTVKCEYCPNEYAVFVLKQIDGFSNLGAKNLILEEEFFNYACPACGKNKSHIYQTLYIDKQKNFAVLCLPNFKGKEIGAADAGIDQEAIDGLEILRVEPDEYNFYERIRILNDGLDDVMVEVLRLISFSQVVDELPECDALGYVSTAGPEIEFEVFSCGNRITSLTINMEKVTSSMTKIEHNLNNTFPRFIRINGEAIYASGIDDKLLDSVSEGGDEVITSEDNLISQNYYSSFMEAYRVALNRLGEKKVLGDVEFELIPVMFVICDYAAACAQKNRVKISDELQSHLNNDYLLNEQQRHLFSDRVDFYGEIIRGRELRAEWLYGNTTDIEKTPIINCIIAFGDILVNPNCADDYSNAPLMLSGFLENSEFALVMMKEITVVFADLFKRVYEA